MGKKSSSPPPAPPPPDPYATARAQTGSNVSTSIANAVMGNAWETSPMGTVKYVQQGTYNLQEPVLDKDGNPKTTQVWVPSPGGSAGPTPAPLDAGGRSTGGEFSPVTGQWTGTQPTGGNWVTQQQMSNRELPIWHRIVELSPEQRALYEGQVRAQQGLLDLTNAQIPRINDLLSRPLDLSGLPEVPLDTEAYRAQTENAMFARMNPQLERDRAALENTLVNQGFQRGTEAFTREMDQFGRDTNDARNQVFLASANEARNQQAQQATNRERALQEMLLQRQLPISEISALMGMSQPSMPQFTPFRASPMSETPVGDYVYRSADIAQRNWQAQAQMQMQQNAANSAGMFGLGSSLLGGLFKLSDRRVKRDIRKVGKADNGLPIYAYRIGDGPTELGFMADEVKARNPSAVTRIGKFDHVDYAEAVQ